MISGDTTVTPGVSPGGSGQAEATNVSNELVLAQQRLNEMRAKEAAAKQNLSAKLEEAKNLSPSDPQAQAKAAVLTSQINAAKEDVQIARSDLVRQDAEVQAARKEVENKGWDLEDVKDAATVAGAAALAYEAFSSDSPPAAPSAEDTLLGLSKTAASTEVQANSQIAEYAGKYGITDLLNNEQLRAAFELSGQTDFGAWLRSELASGSAAGQVINDLTNPFALEQRERGDRLTEASQFYDTYDASSFMSPEQTAAMDYARSAADDPLDLQLRGYIGDELRGEYSPEYYRELRQDLFGNLDPSMQATTHGLGQALLGTEAAKRQRQQQGASMAHQFVGRQQAYAPVYASIAGASSPDPLAISNVGRMGIGEIQPMDPTGPFFSSFPAMAHDSATAAWQGRKTLGDTMTALTQAAEMAAGVYDRRKNTNDALLGGLA